MFTYSNHNARRSISHSLGHLPTTVGSRSTKTARGTCFPEPVSEKNALKESSPEPTVASLGICPSGWIPCSRQYSSQQAFPICTPACPMWMDMHSLCEHTSKYFPLCLVNAYMQWNVYNSIKVIISFKRNYLEE